jgi:type IV pilus assembly protein PilM
MPFIRKKAKAGPIGLDIGSAGIKLMQLTEKDGKPAIVAAAHQEISGDDESVREAATIEFLEKALKHGGFQGRQVVSALGHSEYQMKNIRLPRMPEEELSLAVEFEAKERFDTNGASAQFRHVIAGEVRHGNELKEELIVFAASDEVVKRRLNMLESLNLIPMAIDLAPCAMARSFIRFLRRAEDANAVNVFVDIGRRGSAILITRGTDVAFLKVIDTGGKSMNAAASQNLGISEQEAAELRIRIMRDHAAQRSEATTSVPADVQSAIGDALRPVAERISKDLQLCLRYYAVTFRGHRPDSITLVGGEAHEPVLTKTISESIEIPCIVGYPLRGIQGATGLPKDERSYQPAWSVACGLALRNSQWVTPRRATTSGAA